MKKANRKDSNKHDETAYLLRSPANAKRLLEAVAALERGQGRTWVKQIKADAASGQLDFLFEEAERERAAGTLRDWPEGE